MISQTDIADALKEFRLFELLLAFSAKEIQKGSHSSQAFQVHQEFSNYRAYEPGDDMRFVDWKLFARSDKYYLRQNEIFKRTGISIEIDNSPSMLHQESQLTKLDFAKVIAGIVLQLAFQQGDQFTVRFHSEKKPKVLKSGRSHFFECLNSVFNLEVSESPNSEAHGAFDNSQLHCFISDLHRISESHIQGLQKLSNSKRQVKILRILGPLELGEVAHQNLEFRDLENERQRSWQSRSNESFQETVKKRLQKESVFWQNYGVELHLFRLNDNPIEQMKEWLRTNQKMGAA